ncbi:hypothetical protein PIB30_028478 [Stylosanthes scabra]|uniref:Uncharacterized protein n=1 Tax=Stylosanthes scabra TaxID=79078 RepID=A0ABU6Y9R1_9FABA|nr:hypothetical protein [Stylosanthes scabra]
MRINNKVGLLAYAMDAALCAAAVSWFARCITHMFLKGFSTTVQAERPFVGNDLVRQKGAPSAKEKLHCSISEHTDRDPFYPMGFKTSNLALLLPPSFLKFEIGGRGARGIMSRVVKAINTPMVGEMETHLGRVLIEECSWKLKF